MGRDPLRFLWFSTGSLRFPNKPQGYLVAFFGTTHLKNICLKVSQNGWKYKSSPSFFGVKLQKIFELLKVSPTLLSPFSPNSFQVCLLLGLGGYPGVTWIPFGCNLQIPRFPSHQEKWSKTFPKHLFTNHQSEQIIAGIWMFFGILRRIHLPNPAFFGVTSIFFHRSNQFFWGGLGFRTSSHLFLGALWLSNFLEQTQQLNWSSYTSLYGKYTHGCFRK